MAAVIDTQKIALECSSTCSGTWKRPGMFLKELVSQDDEDEKWMIANSRLVSYRFVLYCTPIILLFQI